VIVRHYFLVRPLIELIESTKSFFETQETRSIDIVSEQIKKFLLMEDMSKAHKILNSDEYQVSSTGGYYADAKIIRIAEHIGWSVSLGRFAAEAPFISTPSCNSIVHRISGEEPLEYISYEVSGPVDVLNSRDPATISYTRKISLNSGSTIAVTPNIGAAIISGNVENSTFLRIDGPTLRKVSLSFDKETHSLVFIGFSDSESTGNHFAVDIIQQILLDSDDPTMILADIVSHNGDQFMKSELYNSNLHISTKWKIAQILSSIDHSQIIDFMTECSKSDNHQLRSKSEAFLAKLPSI
jgi:hypothetical protein